MPFDNLKRSGPQRGAGERAINLPPAILWLIAINVVVHLVRQLLSDSVDQQLVIEFGLVPANITGDQGSLLLSLISLITYQFLHGGWVHLGINMLSLAAFGAPVERLLGVRRFVFFYLSAGVVSAAVHVVFFPDSPDPVIGASGRGFSSVQSGLDARRVVALLVAGDLLVDPGAQRRILGVDRLAQAVADARGLDLPLDHLRPEARPPRRRPATRYSGTPACPQQTEAAPAPAMPISVLDRVPTPMPTRCSRARISPT